MEKVKLTGEQAKAIDVYKNDGHGIQEFLEGREYWNNEYALLKEMHVDDLAKALYVGYEVEKTFKNGDKVTIKKEILEKEPDLPDVVYTIELANDEILLFSDVEDLGMQPSELESASTQRIKEDSERRLWKSIGRELGQFMYGDLGVLSNGLIVKELNNLKRFYENGKLKGIHPAESFISFGGDE